MTTRDTLRHVGLFWLRLTAGIYLMSHGLQKLGMIFGGKVFTPEFEFWPTLGLSPQLAFVGLAASEFLFSLLVVVGLFTRVATLPVIFSMCVAAFIYHAQPGQTTFVEGEKALLYVIAFSTLLLTGPGVISLDTLLGQWWGRRRGEKRMVGEIAAKRPAPVPAT